MDDDQNKKALDQNIATELTSDIVSAYVSHNPIGAGALPDLIRDVHQSVTALTSDEATKAPVKLKPAVPIKKSVNEDYIVCLEDGLKFKSLRRHLQTHYGMTPEDYRAKWNLPADYPMVAPSYSRRRSQLAKQNKLGHSR